MKTTGTIKWQGEQIFISDAVRGEQLGLVETALGDWTVHFLHVELGRIDRGTRTFTPTWNGRRRPR